MCSLHDLFVVLINYVHLTLCDICIYRATYYTASNSKLTTN